MRLLIVAMAESIHTANWIDRIADQGWDVHLFSVIDELPHPKLKNVTVHAYSSRRHHDAQASVRICNFWGLPRGSGLLNRLSRKLCSGLLDALRCMALVIRIVQRA